ncbi:uncharacterized protein [Dendrobates tinctorius]|uniref:uncharacterized protein n=1 Tax=Dendrobates tinctorius TaxID=92724 RepID=UPI003CCA596B
MGRSSVKTQKSMPKPTKSTTQTDMDDFLKKQTVPSDSLKPSKLRDLTSLGDSDSEPESDSDTGSTAREALVTRSFIKRILSKALEPIGQELAEIKHDLKLQGHRLETLENSQVAMTQSSNAVLDSLKVHELQLHTIHTVLEDHENRERRNNIRVKGLSETVAFEALWKATQEIFKELLNESDPQEIELVRVHRALRPRPSQGETPRDVICRFLDYRAKDLVLRRAREAQEISYEGSQIKLFQDLSASTLRKRRILKPFTEALIKKGVRFRWLFPFGVHITNGDKGISARTSQDIKEACESLGIELEAYPDLESFHSATLLHPLPDDPAWQIALTPKSQRLKRKLTKTSLPKDSRDNT